MATSEEFCNLGDQWLIHYAYAASSMPVPTLFTVGQCLEAYCKAALLKNDPHLSIYQQRYGHDIESMIGEIRANIGILSSIAFLPNVESRFMTGGPIPFTDTIMSDQEYLHYVPNQELNWVAKFQKDLKYIGTSGKNMPIQFSITVMERNPFWIPIFAELRAYLRSDATNETLAIWQLKQRGQWPPEVKYFLGRALNISL